MTFLSGKFLFFVIAAVVFYFLVPLKHRWIVLLVSSMIFYASSGIQMVPFLLVTTAVVYGAARWIDSVYEKRLAYIKEQGPDRAEKKGRRLQALLIRAGHSPLSRAAERVLHPSKRRRFPR